jgi:beta-lactamase regulating signal transducer with metallopeptidase domain
MTLQHVLNLAERQTIQVTILIALAGLVMPLLARRRSHLAYVLWLAVLIKSVTPPVWSSPLGIFSFSGSTTHTPTQNPKFDRISSSGAALPISEISSAIQSRQISVSEGWTLAERAIAAWAIGCAGFTLFIVIRWIVLQRQITRSSMETPREISEMLSDLRRELGVRRWIDLRICDDPIGPAMIGLFRPVLVIPGAILHEKTAAQLRPLVAHEIIHLRRGDPLVAALQVISQAIWWFNPLVWWMNRQIVRVREFCCDAEVIAGVDCPRDDYAQMLIDVLRLRGAAGAFVAMPGIRPVHITTRRLDQIMSDGLSHRRTPVRYWMLLALCALVLLPGACKSTGGATTEASASGGDGNQIQTSMPTPHSDADQTAEDLPRMRTSLQSEIDQMKKEGYGDINPQMQELNNDLAVLNRKLEMYRRILSSEPQPSQNWSVRHSVALVVGVDGLTFRGQPTTIDKLPGLLQAVPDRTNTVLELAYASGEVTMSRFGEVQDRASELATQCGFAYLSLSGQHPADYKGSPDQMILMSGAEPTKILPALTPAPFSELTHVIPIQIGESGFKPGDSIVITEVRGTSDHFEVDGTYQVRGMYTLASHDHATLSISVSAKDPRNAVGYIGNAQSINITRGSGTFTVTERMACEGYPHIGFKSDDGGFGDMYFGAGSWISP